MTKQNQIYKCSVCGNVVEVLHSGAGELVCCGQSMNLLEEKKENEGQEKHLPVMEKLPEDVCRGGDGYIIKVGEDVHPMEEDHYIEWIEVKTNDGKIGKKYLKPSDSTEVKFYTQKNIQEVRVYCNVHGLWKASF